MERGRETFTCLAKYSWAGEPKTIPAPGREVSILFFAFIFNVEIESFVLVCITLCDIKRLPSGESSTGHVAL
jgi:hypothetical protein